MSTIDRRFLNISIIVNGVANQPAVGVSAGTQYIVGDTPASAFAEATAGDIARYEGSNWTFITPKTTSLEVFDQSKGQILKFNGTAWEVVASLTVPPVLDIIETGATLPATCAEGDTFLNTSDNKLYATIKGPNTGEETTYTWNTGEALTAGDRYASSTDNKVYTFDGEDFVTDTLLDGASFYNRADGLLYIYDKSNGVFLKVGADLVHFTEVHTLTAAEATAEGFQLTHSIVTGQEANVLLFVSGVAQAANIDFTASGDYISWMGDALENVGIAAGDVFIVHYLTE